MPDDRADFEQHPDIRQLKGMDRLDHVMPNVQASAELMKDAPVLVDLANVQVGDTVHVVAGSQSKGTKEFSFTRQADPEGEGKRSPSWNVSRYSRSQDKIVEEPAVIHGSAASPTGSLLEDGPPVIRRDTYLSFARVYRFPPFRGGEDIPDPQFAGWQTPEELDPNILAAYLKDGSVVRGKDGLLRHYGAADLDRSAELMTGRVISAEVIPAKSQDDRLSAARGAIVDAADGEPEQKSSAEAPEELRPPLEWAVIHGVDRRLSNLEGLRGKKGHEDDPISEKAFWERTHDLAGDWSSPEGHQPSLAERQRKGKGPNPEADAQQT